MSENFGLEVKTRRLKLGLSQEKLADILGYSLSNISRWEAGLFKPKSPGARRAVLSDLEELTKKV